MEALMERQIALEEEMRTTGIDRYRAAALKAATKDRNTSRKPVKRMLDAAHPRAVAAIGMFRAEMSSGKAGRRGSAAAAFEKVNDDDLLAHMALRVVLDSITTRPSLPRSAILLGSLIDDELLFRAFKAQSPLSYKHVTRKLKTRSDEKYRRNSGKGSARAAGIEHQGWDQRTCLQVGLKLIEFVVDTTNLVTIERMGGFGAKSPQHLVGTKEVLEWISTEDFRLDWRSPLYMPTIIPPKAWEGLRGGGYHSGRARIALVKTPKQDHLKEANLTQVYAAVNAIQETPWAINTRVLEIMDALWDGRSDNPVVPQLEDSPFPNKPWWLTVEWSKDDATAAQLADFTEWKRAKFDVHEGNERAKSKRFAFRSMMLTADKFKDEEAIYFPHQLDFRGRIYPTPLYLHPQGDDAQRGLIQFARSVPISDEDGARWLAIHGAGLWGVDKVDFDARVNWVEDNEAAIFAVATDPLAHKFWMDAEKPWQALAFCFEWAAFKAHGYGYESTLPVQMDGSCNGLQNFSAILRDPVGGAAVNLVPADRPSDIYSEVARLVDARVRADAGRDDDEGRLARGWVGKVDRKVCKRPVMTLAYGASKFGFRDQVFTDTVKPWREKKDGTFPWEGSGNAPAQYLGNVIWDCVGEVVVAARAVMGWLQDATRVANEAGKPLQWATPTGFVVRQEYMIQNTVQIKALFRTHNVRIYLNEESDKLDKRRQVSSVSPNWVHSLDASHLMCTVNAAHALGLRSFSMIHDSYGTHAGNAHPLAMVLREEFVRMYSDNHVLDQFAEGLAWEGLDLPPIPAKGNLDLSTVLESQFFFA